MIIRTKEHIDLNTIKRVKKGLLLEVKLIEGCRLVVECLSDEVNINNEVLVRTIYVYGCTSRYDPVYRNIDEMIYMNPDDTLIFNNTKKDLWNLTK